MPQLRCSSARRPSTFEGFGGITRTESGNGKAFGHDHLLRLWPAHKQERLDVSALRETPDNAVPYIHGRSYRRCSFCCTGALLRLRQIFKIVKYRLNSALQHSPNRTADQRYVPQSRS